MSEMIPEFHSSPFVHILKPGKYSHKQMRHTEETFGVSFVLRNGDYNPEATEFTLYVSHA